MSVHGSSTHPGVRDRRRCMAGLTQTNCTPLARSLTRTVAPCVDTLEPRQLMAFNDWGDAERLMRLPDAIDAYHSLPLDGGGETIAIVDSGIDYNHPSLGGGFGAGFKVIGGYDFVDNDANPMDTFGHGTEVAGVIGADDFTADGKTFRGMAPAAKLVALRIDGNGNSTVPDERIERALRWIIDHPALNINAVNISYGTGDFSDPTVNNVYGDELQALADAGIVVVAASGNGGVSSSRGGIDTPAADPSVISVGSVDTADTISNFSERAAVLTLLAPGENVYTTLRNGGFGIVDGTSFASPAVAGTVALMRQIDSSLTGRDVRSILRASSVPNFDGDTETGLVTHLNYPRLDVLAAMKLTESRRAATPDPNAPLGKFGNGNSIAVDRDGVTHFVYYDALAQTMKYATRALSGEWSAAQTIDDSLPFAGYYLSLAIDQFGRPGVAYFDGTNGDLKYAQFDGIGWNVDSVDVKNSTGLYPSLLFDRNNHPVIAYYRKTTGDLRAASRDAGGEWSVTQVDTNGDVGRSTAIAIDGAGRIGVAYEYSSGGDLKYAVFDPRSTSWSNAYVDKSTSGVSFVSLAFDPGTNRPAISYYDASPADLKVARSTGKTWSTTKIATRGATGLFTNIFFATDDAPRVVFWDKRRDATQLAGYENGTWGLHDLRTAGGRFASVGVDYFAGIYHVVTYNTATATLGVEDFDV